MDRKAQWHGTLIIIGQPAEETIGGAKAMLADHLYERFGKPDFVLSEHDSNDMAAGTIGVKGGPLAASATSINVTVRGIGGHGSAPQAGKDPIVLAAEFVMTAQTIVSRQIDPQEPAVLTVGMIHGGTKNNIIPDEVTMGLTLRAYSPEVRDQVIAAIKREAKGLAEGYGIPEDRMPTVTIVEGTPATYNDPALAERVARQRRRAWWEPGAGCAGDHGQRRCGLLHVRREDSGRHVLAGRGGPGEAAESRKTGVPLPSPHSALSRRCTRRPSRRE